MNNILIIGDGIIGMLSALTLSSKYKNVYLIKTNKKDYHNSNQDRYFSINLLSKYFFKKIDIWNDIMISNPISYNKIITWDDRVKDDVIFESSSVSYNSLGYIIKEKSIINSLEIKLLSLDNIISINKSDIKDIAYNDDSHKISFSNMKSINLDLIIKSDNTLDDFFNTIKFKMSTVDYNQHAVVVNLFLKDRFINNIAYQKFSQGQIMGLLPISDNQYNLIWSVDNNILQYLNNYDDEKILSILNDNLSDKIGLINSISTSITFPLSGFHVKSYVTNNVLAIGGAAHSVHPMAGLGLNMGIQDIYLLDNSFLNENSNDYNMEHVLSNFNRSCMIENDKTYNAINFLKMFYSDKLIPRYIRAQSLKIFENSKYLKIKAIESATGIDLLKRKSREDYCYPD